MRLTRHTATFAFSLPVAVTAAALTLGGCATEPGLLTTQSLPKVAKPAVDPACTQLSAQIADLRREGTVGRVEQVADGKTRMVNIKRASLKKVAELNRLNSEYRAKCSAPGITPAAARAAQPALVPTAADARAAAAKVASTKATAAQLQAQAKTAKLAVKAAQ
ncbi:MAG: hypothetical protein AAFQ45_15485 [Pseudomonadota bacterium]